MADITRRGFLAVAGLTLLDACASQQPIRIQDAQRNVILAGLWPLEQEMRDAPYQTPVYFMTPVSHYDNTQTAIAASALEQALERENWKVVEEIPRASKDNPNLVIELQKGHHVLKCEKEGHIIKARDTYSLTKILLNGQSLRVSGTPTPRIYHPNGYWIKREEIIEHQKVCHPDLLEKRFTLEAYERAKKTGRKFQY